MNELERKTYYVRNIPVELIEAIKKAARERGMYVHAWVERALRKALREGIDE